MIRGKNKIYIGSNPEGYINCDMMNSIFEYLVNHELYENAKVKPKKLGDNYLIEIEANEHTKELLQNLKSMRKIKLYKRTHSWEEIYKMHDQTVKSS
ncbi:MAG: hypothetical protein ACRCXT_10350 [Paraclostridium sp.]